MRSFHPIEFFDGRTRQKSALLLDDLVAASTPPEDFVVCTPTALVLFDSEKLKTVTLVQLGRNVSL